MLDSWRKGGTEVAVLQWLGSVDWWFHIYKTRSREWKLLGERSKPEYARRLRIVADLPLTKKQGAWARIGDLPVSQFTPALVDKLYERLVAGDGPKLKRGRLRQAAFEIDVLKIAWRGVQRLHPEVFPKGNPFEGLRREKRGTETKVPATLDEAYALADALRDAGHPGLGACALIAFEWLQRPEDIMTGALTWGDYQPGQSVRIKHPKTGAEVRLPLVHEGVALYPELEAYLAGLREVGRAIVLRQPEDRPIVLRPDGKPYPVVSGSTTPFRYAHGVVQKVRKKAQLPAHLTLSACRHGGITELGDADLTEQQEMALSGHTQPATARRYVKKTEEQRLLAARKRRTFRESAEG